MQELLHLELNEEGGKMQQHSMTAPVAPQGSLLWAARCWCEWRAIDTHLWSVFNCVMHFNCVMAFSNIHHQLVHVVLCKVSNLQFPEANTIISSVK